MALKENFNFNLTQRYNKTFHQRVHFKKRLMRLLSLKQHLGNLCTPSRCCDITVTVEGQGMFRYDISQKWRGPDYRVTVEQLVAGAAARTQASRQASLDQTQEYTVHLSIHLQCVQFSLINSHLPQEDLRGVFFEQIYIIKSSFQVKVYLCYPV